MALADQSPPIAAAAPSAQPGRSLAALALDIGEKAFVMALFAAMALRMFSAVNRGASWLNLLQLSAEGLVVVLIMLRKPASVVSMRPVDWLLAVGATAGPLLIRPGDAATIGPPIIAAVLMITGLVCQIYAKLTLRFSFGVVPANRGLKISGPYKIVRHPIYLAYLIGQIGFLLLNPTAWNAGVYMVSLVLQIFRIAAEERLLAQDEGHEAFRRATPYRLLPGLY
jgi:protein-S-isoprenylcysteine O-methyltransferase Ste14